MGKIYTTDGKILTGDGFPQIQIKDKLYVVDDRKSTYDKIQKVLKESRTNPVEDKDYDMEIFKLAFGEKEAKEIQKLELKVKEFNELTIYVMAAIQGEEYETIKEAMGKNQ